MKAELIHKYFHPALSWFLLIVTIGLTAYIIYLGAGYVWLIFFFLLDLVLFGTKYRTAVLDDQKMIIDEFYFAFLKTKNKKVSFQKLKRIALDKERTTYKAAQRARDRFADFFSYIARLEFDDGQSFVLLDSTDYESFIEEIMEFANKLNLPAERVY